MKDKTDSENVELHITKINNEEAYIDIDINAFMESLMDEDCLGIKEAWEVVLGK